jgi:hypothetical protein
MDPKELKKILRPLVKELITETLAEYGAAALMSEVKTPAPVQAKPVKKDFESTYRKNIVAPLGKDTSAETKKRIDEELKKAGLLSKKFDPFAGTTALTEGQASGAAAPLNAGARQPDDEGVDITGIMDMASGRWAAHLSGKK